MTTSPTSGAPTASQSQANILSIVAFILAAVAVFFFPIFFGVGAIVAGAVALARKERLGKVALIVAIVATILGMVLGAIVGASQA